MNRPPAPTSALSLGEQSSHAKALFRNNLQGEDAYARHQRYVRDYARFYSSSSGSTVSDPAPNRRTDFDVLKAAHKFIRGEDEVNEADLEKLSYEEQLAVKYYASLFKEYAVCDLKHYKSGNVALRWRTESEVVSGVGQFTCASARCAYHEAEDRGFDRQTSISRPVMPSLRALEVPFAYIEHEKQKQALVKLVLCGRCERKLTWKRRKDKEVSGQPETNDEAERLEAPRRRSSRSASPTRPQSRLSSDARAKRDHRAK